MAELDLNPDIVRSIIDKVHEFHSQDDVTFPDEEPELVDAEFALEAVSDYTEDPYYQELKIAIDDLEPDQQVQLVTLMWIGRGDYSIDEWDEALAFAEENWTDHTAEYLIGTSLVADFLAEGLDQVETSER